MSVACPEFLTSPLGRLINPRLTQLMCFFQMVPEPEPGQCDGWKSCQDTQGEKLECS